MSKRLLMFFFCAAIPLAAFGQDCVPSDALWAKPRTGAAILADSGIRSCVLPLLNNMQASLTLRHTPDEEAVSRAEDLRWWLVAMGLEPDRIRLAAHPDNAQPLVLELTEPK